MEVPPFTCYGFDMFGPFIIRQRRSEAKRYGAMFTCMNSRAVHIEVTHNLDNNSSKQALRGIIARRGNIRTIYSDNGNNFIGAGNEQKEPLKKWIMKRYKHSCKNLVEMDQVETKPVCCKPHGSCLGKKNTLSSKDFVLIEQEEV